MVMSRLKRISYGSRGQLETPIQANDKANIRMRSHLTINPFYDTMQLE
jgi:hypothetical protein